MRPGDKKPAGNTGCIAKGSAEAWGHFCPPKPYSPVSIDGHNSRAVKDRSIQWEDYVPKNHYEEE